MLIKTHISFSLVLSSGIYSALVYTQLIPTFQFEQLMFGLFFILFGTLLPDIDSTQSLLGRRLKPISYVVNKVLGHRGIMHNIPLYVALMLISYSFDYYYPIFIFLGAIFHILGDGLTNNGVRGGMYPLMSNFVLLPTSLRFQVNGNVEPIIKKSLDIIFIALVLNHIYYIEKIV